MTAAISRAPRILPAYDSQDSSCECLQSLHIPPLLIVRADHEHQNFIPWRRTNLHRAYKATSHTSRDWRRQNKVSDIAGSGGVSPANWPSTCSYSLLGCSGDGCAKQAKTKAAKRVRGRLVAHLLSQAAEMQMCSVAHNQAVARAMALPALAIRERRRENGYVLFTLPVLAAESIRSSRPLAQTCGAKNGQQHLRRFLVQNRVRSFPRAPTQ